ncbi:hypothetical protein [Nitrincola nitratireducens]|uniref:hypothetical protein n=1 Tax=Nitrincola nitratireducens TaxID=1229521 RepID=UPI0004B3B6E5|nr:hypothetical protein [Nitrincola nitratireducens]
MSDTTKPAAATSTGTLTTSRKSVNHAVVAASLTATAPSLSRLLCHFRGLSSKSKNPL